MSEAVISAAISAFVTEDVYYVTRLMPVNPSGTDIMPPGFNTPLRKDRPDGYGGVLLATRKDLTDCEIKVESTCELTATKIQVCGQQPLIVISSYRPPKNDMAYALEMCQAIRDVIISNPSAVAWVSGDFNLPDINWSTGSIESHQYTNAINKHFLSTFSDAGLTQIIDFPTRGEKTLDLFLTNRPSLITKCVPLPGVSDHDMVLILSDTRAKRQKPVRHKIFLWKKVDICRMKSEALTLSEDFVEENSFQTDVDTLWMKLANGLHQILDTLVPSKFSSTRFSQPWINANIKRLSRRKKRALKQARKTGRSGDWTRYKSMKSIMQRECRVAYNTFISDMLSEEDGKPKRFWSYIKSTRCENSGIAPLLKDGFLQNDAHIKANLLNEQFSSVFTQENMSNLPDLGESPHAAVPFFSISQEGVRKLLANIKPHTACGPDNLPARLLKETADELAPALCLLFNATLHQGKVPQDWKTANVTPVFKKGDKHKPDNYRPISLTSIICKTVEHIIHSQIMRHLDTHGLLAESQFGFRRGHSCESQLLITVQDLAAGLRDKQQIDAVLLDLSKAFDRVPHKRLLLKLHFYGIRGQLLSWIHDFLQGRTQRVTIEGVKSDTTTVSSGVPQGPVLGPLLFLVFINDLPEYVSSSIPLYADDALIYRSIESLQDTEALHQDLANVQEWEKRWLMSFNPDKCEVLRISNKRRNIIASNPYLIHGTALPVVDEAKYLGVTIQRNLSWKSHINNICKRSNRTLGFLRRNLRRCPQAIKEQAYKTYIRPTLEYSSSVWDPHTKELISQIETVQRRAARFVLSDYRQQSSVALMLQKLQWQSLNDRRAHNKFNIADSDRLTRYHTIHPPVKASGLSLKVTSYKPVPKYWLCMNIAVHGHPIVKHLEQVVRDIPECNKYVISQLGMSSGKINDDSIKASSSAYGSAPYFARLNYPNGWRPSSADSAPWLQIKLPKMAVVYGFVATVRYVATLHADASFHVKYAENEDEELKDSPRDHLWLRWRRTFQFP
ncbi:uncharacterized protein [Diadema antillarum]|uniref:uncharacterized protein n=1 Tax=Diadema antillarum TaxID=105358 RepID=UPI003A87B286